MKRSAGVTAVAVVSLLGSVLAICFGILTGVMAFVMPRPASASAPALPPTALLVTAGAVYFLPGVWGLASGIGLVRLKNWARISTIVFGVLLILFGGFTAVMMVLMSTISFPSDQVDPASAASVMTMMRAMMGALALGEIGIGAWWVIFLTRAKVAQQFTGDGTATTGIASRRPISITIIAWLMLIGVPGTILPLVMHSPVPFFLTTLNGPAAIVYLIAMVAIVAYCGIGLLRLQPAARLVTIGSQVFGLVNTATFALAPGGPARLAAVMEQQQAMMPAFAPGNQAPPPFDPVNVLYFSLAFGTIVMIVVLYFLVTRKRAFAS